MQTKGRVQWKPWFTVQHTHGTSCILKSAKCEQLLFERDTLPLLSSTSGKNLKASNNSILSSVLN